MTGMEYVYTVYEEKSFSRAAKKLFMTQPALSAAVKKVESTLGLPIFDRSHSPLRLTDAGQAYIDAVQKLMPLWMAPVLLIACFVCGILGGLLGRALLKKHFEKAGIV